MYVCYVTFLYHSQTLMNLLPYLATRLVNRNYYVAETHFIYRNRNWT